MRRTVAAVVLVLAVAPAAGAQVIYAPVYGPGFGGGFGYRTGFGIAAGRWGYRPYGFAQGFYAGPIQPYWVPVAGPGWGPGIGNPFFLSPPAGFAPPVVVTPPPIVVVGNTAPADPDTAAPGPARNPNDLLPPGARKGDYLVITPRKGPPEGTIPPKTDRAAPPPPGTITPKIDRVAPPPDRSPPPAPRADPFGPPPVLGKTDTPAADAVAEAARLVTQARAAVTAGEYGQAVELLDRAAAARPDDSSPYFLRAQAQFAAGQYAEAVASIREGMTLAPGWPASGFKPRELYGDKPDRLTAQLDALRKAQAANPTEPALQFLLGYQLWFTGERATAVGLFRDAARMLTDTTLVDRFLRAAEAK